MDNNILSCIMIKRISHRVILGKVKILQKTHQFKKLNKTISAILQILKRRFKIQTMKE